MKEPKQEEEKPRVKGGRVRRNSQRGAVGGAAGGEDEGHPFRKGDLM